MRFATTAQQSALSGQYYTAGLQVWIADGDGTLQNWSARGGTNWVDGVTVDLDVDQIVDQCTVQLRRDAGTTLSLAPFRTDSTMNRNAASAYAPALDAGRAIVIKVATVTYGATITSGDYIELFRGTIDHVDWASSQIALTCRGLCAVLADRFVETAQVYGSAAGTAIETVMQLLMTQWAGGLTLATPTSPGFLVTTYTQQIQSVADALTALVGLIGWTYRAAWDQTSGTWQVQFTGPGRTKTTPDLIIGPNRYLSVTALAIDDASIRNAIDVVYTDRTTGGIATLSVTDATSIARYGRRWMRLQEASNSPINTHNEALDMANAALADLKDPLAEQEIEMHLDWRLEINDLLQWSANSVHYNAAQKLAVVHITHRVQVTTTGAVECRTRVRTRGQPCGGYSTWLARGASGSNGADPTDPTSPAAQPVLPVPVLTTNQVDSSTTPVTITASAKNLPAVYTWALYPGSAQGNYSGTPVLSGDQTTTPLSTPQTLSVAPALKYDLFYELEIRVGLATYRTPATVFGRLLFVDATGAIVHTASLDNGTGIAATSGPGLSDLTPGATDSRGYPLNTHFNTTHQDLDAVNDGPNFGRVASAYVDTLRRPAVLYRPGAATDVGADTLAGALGVPGVALDSDNFELGSAAGMAAGWTLTAGVNLQPTALYAAQGTRSGIHNHGGAVTASSASRPLGTLTAGRVYTLSVKTRHNLGNLAAATVLRCVPASGLASDVTVLSRTGNDYSGVFGYPCDTGSGAINADTVNWIQLSVTFLVNTTQAFTGYLATGYSATTNGFAAYDAWLLTGEASDALVGGYRGKNALDTNYRLVDQRRMPMTGVGGARANFFLSGTQTPADGQLSATGNQITIPAVDLYVGDTSPLSYPTQIITGFATGSPGTKNWVYLIDATYSGSGSFVAVTDPRQLVNSLTRAYLGTITCITSSSGVGQTCPAPETLVRLADGREIPAGRVAVGDVVRTRHECSLEDGDHRVTHASIHTADRWRLALVDGRVLIATRNHRVYLWGHGWTRLDALRPGDVVMGDPAATVVSVHPFDRGPVVKLTVADAHTYLTAGLLSHNQKPL